MRVEVERAAERWRGSEVIQDNNYRVWELCRVVSKKGVSTVSV